MSKIMQKLKKKTKKEPKKRDEKISKALKVLPTMFKQAGVVDEK